VLHAARWNTGRQNSPSGHHRCSHNFVWLYFRS